MAVRRVQHVSHVRGVDVEAREGADHGRRRARAEKGRYGGSGRAVLSGAAEGAIEVGEGPVAQRLYINKGSKFQGLRLDPRDAYFASMPSSEGTRRGTSTPMIVKGTYLLAVRRTYPSLSSGYLSGLKCISATCVSWITTYGISASTSYGSCCVRRGGKGGIKSTFFIRLSNEDVESNWRGKQKVSAAIRQSSLSSFVHKESLGCFPGFRGPGGQAEANT